MQVDDTAEEDALLICCSQPACNIFEDVGIFSVGIIKTRSICSCFSIILSEYNDYSKAWLPMRCTRTSSLYINVKSSTFTVPVLISVNTDHSTRHLTGLQAMTNLYTSSSNQFNKATLSRTSHTHDGNVHVFYYSTVRRAIPISTTGLS